MTQKTIIINLAFLGLGLLLAYALNQHIVGHNVATACELVQKNKNNFIAEIILVLTLGALLFGLRFL